MENEEFDIVIEKARILREKFIEQKVQNDSQRGIQTDVQQLRDKITIKILGEIQEEKDGKKVKKQVFLVEVEGEALGKIYNEDLDFKGAVMSGSQKIILPIELSSKSEEEKTKKRDELSSIKLDSAQTLEEYNAEHSEEQKNKENKIGEDLSKNLEEGENLKVKTSRRLIDSYLPQQFPEMCEGATETLIIELEDGRVGIIADYGDGKGYQKAKGTEFVKPVSHETVYQIDDEKNQVNRESLYVQVPTGKNGESIGLNIGAYGYWEPMVVQQDRTSSAKIARELQTQGATDENGIEKLERIEEAAQGVEYVGNRVDLLEGNNNAANDQMKQNIVDSILLSHEEQLEELYGNDLEKKEEAIRNYIEKSVKKGISVPIEIKRDVEMNIEIDHQYTVLRGRNSP